MTKFDCIFYNGVFLTAKPSGWQWSQAERSFPFAIVKDFEVLEGTKAGDLLQVPYLGEDHGVYGSQFGIEEEL